MRSRPDFPIEPRLVRHADFMAVNPARLGSAAVQGSAAEYFNLIESDAAGVAAADASIVMPHGFNLKAERRFERGGRVGHGSTTAEVLLVHSGCWRVTLGYGEDTSMDLAPGDVASIPPSMYRRWERLDGEMGFLFIAQGLESNTAAGERTAVLDTSAGERRWVQDGRFIDYSSGIPRMREVLGRQDHAGVPGIALPSYRVNAGQIAPCERSPLTAHGVSEAGIISPASTQDGFPQGALRTEWRHGFNLRWLVLQSGAYVARHSRAESEVILLQTGMLEISWDAGAIMLGAGDILSIPAGLPCALRNTTSKPTDAFIVRGSDDPATPQFESMPALKVVRTAHPSARI